MTESACTVTRSKLYPTPGRSYRFAWKWLYTVTIPGEPYTFDGDTLGWVRSLCKSKAPRLPIVYAWKTEEASPATKSAHSAKKSTQLDREIAEVLGARPINKRKRVRHFRQRARAKRLLPRQAKPLPTIGPSIGKLP